MNNFLASLGALVVAIPLVIGIALLGLMWSSWWLYPAWGWFIVPLGLPPIAYWHFVALTLFAGTFRKIDTKVDERKTEWASVVVGFLWPVLAWALLRWMR